ncbi:hypothetical protein LJC08_05030 [Methanimicrococcus sp. OttesenSCG-928-J09]|nr:hypothetical protein [Methanimicrococcus sp. OttesenSCG-928-J09]
MLFTGAIFLVYEDATFWILAYIAFAVLGNIGMLIAMYKFLVPNRDGLKFVIVYEIAFIIIMLLTYAIISMQLLPAEGIGNINFETILNAVLPFTFILLTLAEFILSKGLRLMPIKAV